MRLKAQTCLPALAAGVLLLSGGIAARAAGEAQTTALSRKVIISGTVNSVDDYLLAVARAGKVNLIADATRFDAIPFAVPSDFRAEQPVMLGFYFSRGTRKLRLSLLQPEPNTFLLWPEPGVRELGRRLATVQWPPDDEAARTRIARRVLAQDEGADEPTGRQEREAEKVHARLVAYQTSQLLRDYYQRVHGWDGRSPAFERKGSFQEVKDVLPQMLPQFRAPESVRKIRLTDLPPDLRDKILAYARGLADRTWFEFARGFFNDEFWQKARIRLIRGDAQLTVGLAGSAESRLHTFASLNKLQPNIFQRNSPPRGKPMDEAEPPPANDVNPAGMETKVSLDTKRMPLGQVLAILQKQSGITLTTSADIPPTTTLVTARVRQMPLSDLMQNLARLYDAAWNDNADGAHVLKPKPRSDFERPFFRVGRIGTYLSHRLWEKLERTGQIQSEQDDAVNWPLEISAVANMAVLRSKEGVPVSALDEELQRALRALVEEQLSVEMLERLTVFNPALAEEGYLCIGSTFGGSSNRTRPEEAIWKVFHSSFLSLVGEASVGGNVMLFPNFSHQPQPDPLLQAALAAQQEIENERKARGGAAP